MKLFKAIGFGIASIIAVGSPAVTAEELDFTPGFYLVATAGETTIDYTSSLKLGGNGYAIGAGYDVNKYVAIEAQLNNYFDYTVNGDNYSVTGTSFRGLLRYPLGSWAPFIGYTYASAQDTLTVNNTTYTGAGTLSGVSVGFEVAMTETLALRFITDSLETDTAVEATVSQLGIVARF